MQELLLLDYFPAVEEEQATAAAAISELLLYKMCTEDHTPGHMK
jgi:hypothetical protein